MSKIDEFKSFVKRNPSLISYVKLNEKSWQNFFELYDLYGEDSNVWNEYLQKSTEKDSYNSNKMTNNNTWSELINMAKKMDVNKVQEGIVSLQKAIGLVSDLFIKDDKKVPEYKPRPLYRNFED